MPWRFLSEALQSMAARWETRKGSARGKGGWPFANEKSYLVTRALNEVSGIGRTDAILKIDTYKVDKMFGARRIFHL